MKKACFYLIPIVLVLVVTFSSCEYEYIIPEELDPTIIISFDTIISPIFTDQSCTNCHKNGGTSPNLTIGNAYSNIVPDRVKLNDPESSKIYTKPHPDGEHYQKYTSIQAKNVLQWIKQGALDN